MKPSTGDVFCLVPLEYPRGDVQQTVPLGELGLRNRYRSYQDLCNTWSQNWDEEDRDELLAQGRTWED